MFPAVMFVILGFIVAFVLIALFANREVRHCRWREDRAGDRDGLRRYVCAACGAVTMCTPGRSPQRCLFGQEDGRDA